MLDNRETATLIWLGAGLLSSLFHRNVRESLGVVARSFLQLSIIIPVLAMLAWVGLELWVGLRLTMWNADLAKGTIFWTLGSAGVLLFNCTEAASEPRFFWRTLRGTVGVLVSVQFFVNLHSFGLPAELILQFAIICLTLLVAFAGSRSEYKSSKALCQVLLTVIVFALVMYTAKQVFSGWEQTDGLSLFLEFLLPVWLTVGFLPFLWVLSIYLVYDTAFTLINSETHDSRSRWRSKLALLSGLHCRTPAVDKFRWYWTKQISEAPTFTKARRVVASFREKQRRAKQTEAEERDRICRYTGSQETDAEGRRLDRREFSATRDALRWVATCQMGWYRRCSDRYRADLLDVIGGNFPQGGLPKDPEMSLDVSEDGQSWYAWRRSVTGWCFAIGAAGAPPNQWEYDGPEPPEGFPGEDQAWGDSPFADQANRNWR